MKYYMEKDNIGRWHMLTPDGKEIGVIDWDKGDYYPMINGSRIHDEGKSWGSHLHSPFLMVARKMVLDHIQESEMKPAEIKRNSNVRFLPQMDRQFYPTPSWLVGKMIGKINWKDVRTILEPSAGKGDIIDALQKVRLKYRSPRSLYSSYELLQGKEIDAIEIDEDLRHILNDKEIRVVGDDFLRFNAAKKYDVAIMNPPFAQGAAHLMKAIRLMKRGGQIVCLLNANTILHPSTLEQMDLVKELQKYNGRVEYIDGFRNAQRTANVKIAIVSLSIPAPDEKESLFWGKIKKAKESEFKSIRDNNELATGSFIDQLILHFQMETNAAYAFFREYNALSKNLRCSFEEKSSPMIGLKVGRNEVRDTFSSADWNEFVKVLREKYWRALFDRSEITRLMTSAVSQRYSEKMNELKEYEFSKFNIQQIMDDLSFSMKTSVEDAIEHLFDELSSKHSWYEECANNIHYYNGWRTNEAHKVGMKAILPVNGYRSNYKNDKELDTWHICSVIADLELALSYLDYGTTVGLNMKWDISSAVSAAASHLRNNATFTYFDATFYKKGTCHIKFHPEAEKLIDRLNIFVGQKRNWLPPCYGKKHYNDMTDEEKTVVESFQAPADYEKMMEVPEDYIRKIGSDVLRLETAA